jgi:integrase
VDRSTKCLDRATAYKVLKKWRGEIERGEFAEKGEPTFADAVLRYINAGGSTRFLKPIVDYFGQATLLRDVTQATIDKAARELYPGRSPATINRQLYTPISAVLKYVGGGNALKRPKGSAGKNGVRWLWPEEADRVFAAASELDREFGALLVFLCHTGLRLGEALSICVRDLRLVESFLYLPTSKNEEPRAIFLSPVVLAALSGHPRGLERPRERLFRFTKSGHLYALLRTAFFKAEVELDERQGFHLFCHTWATWMRRYGGLDTKGLVATGRWKDRKSADRYEHVVVSEEAQKAVLLPAPKARSV